MPDFRETILQIAHQFYPTGRAFKMPIGSNLEMLHLAAAESENDSVNDARAILDAILPDNDGFTEDDATDWERRLGLITNSEVDLEDRKAAILRKMRFPGTNPCKEHYLYLQAQLQLAGFNVYVYENRFADYPEGWTTQSPIEITGDSSLLKWIQHGQIQHGENQHGYVYTNVLANYIDEEKDLKFDIGDNFRSTIYIGGDPLGSYADVPLARKNEFRETILKIKPAQVIAFLFINYI